MVGTAAVPSLFEKQTHHHVVLDKARIKRSCPLGGDSSRGEPILVRYAYAQAMMQHLNHFARTLQGTSESPEFREPVRARVIFLDSPRDQQALTLPPVP
jgi:hypothetical protein